MKYLLGEEWSLQPAGGATGEAYIARQGDQKVFIKRNSSPFLAVLSAEGIVPKLLWTRRLESGDVITAQEWVNGRKLTESDMKQYKVPKLLSKIHRSHELLSMFLRLGNSPINPQKLIDAMKEKIAFLTIKDPYVLKGLTWLEENGNELNYSDYVVCHADIHHKNWLMSGDQLYLIDWDGAIITDPAVDLAPILYIYVQRAEWERWLKEYGLPITDELLVRLRWYMVAHCIENILWYWQRQEFEEITSWADLLSEIIHEK